MTDKDIKKQIKTAYAVVPSDEEKAFIRRYEKRAMQMHRVIFVEAKYMCMSNLAWSIPLFVILVIISKVMEPKYAWAIASMLPLCAVVPLISIGKSDRCRMAELEAACRFSLKFIRMVRLFILGILSLLLILAGSVILKEICQVGYLHTFLFCSLPFLLNVWGCLCITRKWQAKENIFGCIAVTIFSCLLPMSSYAGLWLTDDILLIAVCIILFFIGKEAFMYVKGSEDVTWNLC